LQKVALWREKKGGEVGYFFAKNDRVRLGSAEQGSTHVNLGVGWV
jgi:hypothetical protein